ncbi:MAG: hypothetical protein SOU50_03195 [Oscillospiraceae bacterium]|nr:DUF3592 domain-containing protein [Oscillospiraceae bacterium]MDD7429600.1 hypothetical protein [Oscillospiraceae bacterium]MDY2847204.1 hypothetical protein [Oscillospiraceae bacterium]
MKIKKRYIIACVLLCVLSILISMAVFHLEMTLSKFSKMNDIISSSWNNSELMVTGVVKDTSTLEDDEKVFYLGKVTYIENGKYIAYNKDTYMGSNVVTYYGEAKLGDKINLYYKPDDPEVIEVKAPLTTYIIALGVLLVIDVALIVVARLLNKSLKENTFSDASVSIMDIPICVLVAGFIICFFTGMFIGNVSVDSYGQINEAIAQEYYDEGNQYTFGHAASASADAEAE